MTLSELLHTVTFEEVAPYIVKYHGDDKCMAGYKIHFDLLRGMKPSCSEGDNKIATISHYEGIGEEEIPPLMLDAYPLEGDYWEVSLAKELVINPDVNATWKEIAACCLFHTSFYGFTQDDKKDTFDSWIDERRGNNKLKNYRQIYGKEMPSIKQMLEKRSFHNYIRRKMKLHRRFRAESFTKEDKLLLGYTKRKWRMWKHWEIATHYREIILGRCNFFHHVVEDGYEPPTLDSKYLNIRSAFMNAEHCFVYRYKTYANDIFRRLEYFKELVEKYNAFRDTTSQSCIIKISSSSRFPPTTEEEKEIAGLILTKCTDSEPSLLGIDIWREELGKELQIDIAFYG